MQQSCMQLELHATTLPIATCIAGSNLIYKVNWQCRLIYTHIVYLNIYISTSKVEFGFMHGDTVTNITSITFQSCMRLSTLDL